MNFNKLGRVARVEKMVGSRQVQVFDIHWSIITSPAGGLA